MVFSFFRLLRRKLRTCLLVILVVVLFKKAYPAVGAQIGQWISGLGNVHVAEVFSSLLARLREGGALEEIVEVFRNGISSG